MTKRDLGAAASCRRPCSCSSVVNGSSVLFSAKPLPRVAPIEEWGHRFDSEKYSAPFVGSSGDTVDSSEMFRL